MATPAHPVKPATPPPADIQNRGPLVTFSPNDVPPSQSQYLQTNDQFLFVSLGNTTGTVITFRYRILTPQGEIVEGTILIPVGVLQQTFLFPAREGWLLSFGAIGQFSVSPGQWQFLQVGLARTLNINLGPMSFSLIWQGYMPWNTYNGFPGTPAKEVSDGAGTIRSIVGTQPALGAEINEIAPNNRRWNLIAFRFGITTSATVANRFPSIVLDDGANVFWNIHTNSAVPATSGGTYDGAQSQTFYNDTNANFVLPLPSPLSLKQGCRIRSQTVGLQAGDQYTAPIYLLQEWGLWDI